MPHRPEGTLANRIRDLRSENGRLTQEQLAERAQVTRQTIIAVEAGRYVPSLILAMRIARALKHSVEEVFCLDD
ncbi:MAG TPA: helix-turn-helix transcriptional regulator [Pirellulales bacterium]|jgi:putative transcriptional regulator|nr:helix-turn-helix transcriptional regulator [Pirellulales bacterium]